MKLLNVGIKEEAAYILPVGDLHLGDVAFKGAGKQKLIDNLNWALESKHPAKIFIMGDVFNLASRSSKTSPFESDPDEIFEAEEIFRPYKSLIIGAVYGNHERRVKDHFGYDPLRVFCNQLSIPYCGASAVIRVQVGKRDDSDSYWQTYNLYAHHGTGGGSSVGNALNVCYKLERIISGCDAYMVGHSHQLVTGVREVYYPSSSSVKMRKVHYLVTGSYLNWNASYAEDFLLAPSKLGSPRIRLDGRRDRHDLHCSI